MMERYIPTEEERLKELQIWAEAAEREIDEISAAMAPLEQRLQNVRERLDLIQRMIQLANRSKTEVPSQSISSRRGVSAPLKIGVRLQKNAELEEWLTKILEKSGQPMHITELRNALIERGVPLPGRGDEANIILRLSRAKDQFIRTGRGTYGLAAWGVKPVQRIRKKRKAARRREEPK
jgi:uncharacterized coiled-coil protein SlyX